MESYIKKLDRVSNVFKVLTVFAIFVGLFRLAAIFLPSLGLARIVSLGGSGDALVGLTLVNAIVLAVADFASTALTVFFLYTASLVLEFFAQVGEDVHILRRSEWERRQIAGGKTQKMD